jgi:SET domain-containing protein
MSKEYYRPLPDCLTINEAKWLSKITGKRQLGLFATEVIYQDEILGVTHYDDDRGYNGMIRTPLGGFFNHSETPNCKLIVGDGERKLVTIKEIYSGEEITVRYLSYDPTK